MIYIVYIYIYIHTYTNIYIYTHPAYFEPGPNKPKTPNTKGSPSACMYVIQTRTDPLHTEACERKQSSKSRTKRSKPRTPPKLKTFTSHTSTQPDAQTQANNQAYKPMVHHAGLWNRSSRPGTAIVPVVIQLYVPIYPRAPK